MVYKAQIGKDKKGNPVYGEFNNIYEQEIESYLSDNQLTPFEEEALKFSISIRSKVINDLSFDNSIQDEIKVEIIKSIESKYILSSLKTSIELNVTFSKLLKDFQPFDYNREIKSNLSRKVKSVKVKGKAGRPPDPKIAEMRDTLHKHYYHLTETKGYKKSKAIQILTEKYPWKKSTIEKYIK